MNRYPHRPMLMSTPARPRRRTQRTKTETKVQPRKRVQNSRIEIKKPQVHQIGDTVIVTKGKHKDELGQVYDAVYESRPTSYYNHGSNFGWTYTVELVAEYRKYSGASLEAFNVTDQDIEDAKTQLLATLKEFEASGATDADV